MFASRQTSATETSRRLFVTSKRSRMSSMKTPKFFRLPSGPRRTQAVNVLRDQNNRVPHVGDTIRKFDPEIRLMHQIQYRYQLCVALQDHNCVEEVVVGQLCLDHGGRPMDLHAASPACTTNRSSLFHITRIHCSTLSRTALSSSCLGTQTRTGVRVRHLQCQ